MLKIAIFPILAELRSALFHISTWENEKMFALICNSNGRFLPYVLTNRNFFSFYGSEILAYKT